MHLPQEIIQEHNLLTGVDAMQIDLANCYGLDKQTWEDRLLWAELHHNKLADMADTAESPMLYKKALHAYEMSQKGFSIGHNMFLDACNSGAQIYAALTGCKTTARNCGLILTDTRLDAYTQVTAAMDGILGGSLPYTRSQIKDAVMTALYNSRAEPIKLCGEDTPELAAFYQGMHRELPGAMVALSAINSYWNPSALFHEWELPDGHVAHVLVTDTRTARVEVDELEHVTFAYRFESNEPSENYRSLAPNIIHSIDGYIVREMVRRAKEQGFHLAHVHDAFCFHPNYFNAVTQMYREIFAEIAKSNLLEDILSQISGTKVKINKFSNDLATDILASKYMLS